MKEDTNKDEPIPWVFCWSSTKWTSSSHHRNV